MNEKVNLDLKNFKFIFEREKKYITPIIIIIVSIFLFLQFVIPQFGALLAARDKMTEEMATLHSLQENLDLLNSIDVGTLDNQFTVLSSALPIDKDFSRMLNSIYFSARQTGVTLGNFSFQVGNLSLAEGANNNVPTLRISLPIAEANPFLIRNFVKSMQETFPLVKISLVRIDRLTASVDLSFYYQPLTVSSNLSDKVELVSQEGIDLINDLSGFTDSAEFSEQAPTNFFE